MKDERGQMPQCTEKVEGKTSSKSFIFYRKFTVSQKMSR